MDAAHYKIPHNGDCIFFFNPFDESVMTEIMDNIIQTLKNIPDKFTLFMRIHFTRAYL